MYVCVIQEIEIMYMYVMPIAVGKGVDLKEEWHNIRLENL